MVCLPAVISRFFFLEKKKRKRKRKKHADRQALHKVKKWSTSSEWKETIVGRRFEASSLSKSSFYRWRRAKTRNVFPLSSFFFFSKFSDNPLTFFFWVRPENWILDGGPRCKFLRTIGSRRDREIPTMRSQTSASTCLNKNWTWHGEVAHFSCHCTIVSQWGSCM